VDTGTAAGLFVFGFAAMVFFFVFRTIDSRPELSVLVEEEIHRGAVVLDVRAAGEFEDDPAPGAVSCPLEELESRLDELVPAGRSAVVYCGTGERSARAADLLRQRGRKVIDAKTRASFRD
jgi:rhodanese-related sulfurtransferase